MFAKNAAPQRWGFICPCGEKVDTRDLKSLDQEWSCGFESRFGHKISIV